MNEDNDKPAMEPLMTPEEVMKALSIGRTRVYDMLATGDLPSVRIGRLYRVRRSDLIEWINRKQVSP